MSKKKQDPKFERVRGVLGRPLALTPELQERIVKQIEAGNYVDTACRVCGISKKTYYEWFKRAKQGEQPFLDFRDAVEMAGARAESNHVTMLAIAAQKGKIAASMWWLERKLPKRYGRKLELTGELDSKVEIEDKSVDMSKLTREEIKVLRALRAKAGASIVEVDEDEDE